MICVCLLLTLPTRYVLSQSLLEAEWYWPSQQFLILSEYYPGVTWSDSDIISWTPTQKVWGKVWCEHFVSKLQRWIWCAVLKFTESGMEVKGSLPRVVWGAVSCYGRNWLQQPLALLQIQPPAPAPTATAWMPVSLQVNEKARCILNWFIHFLPIPQEIYANLLQTPERWQDGRHILCTFESFLFEHLNAYLHIYLKY